MSTTAIAILNYNGKKFLEKFLPTLIKYSDGFPIYIGDNASTDESVSFTNTHFPEVNLVLLKQNYGYSKGYNLLIDNIKEDYIAIINSDIEVTENWINPLISELDKNSLVAAVQPKIKSYQNKELFEYAGAAGGFIDKYGYPFCRGRLFDSLEKDEGQYDDLIEIKWASGACFLVRKSTFEKVGRFDDDFFAHMEEIDLCWRFNDNGFLVKYTPESTVYHVGGGTLAYESSYKTYLNFRNGLYLLLKNIPPKELQQKIIIRVLLDWLSAFYFLLQGKWKQASSVLKAHREVLKSKNKFLEKRKSEIGTSKFTTQISTVWSYYILGKKNYSELKASVKDSCLP